MASSSNSKQIQANIQKVIQVNLPQAIQKGLEQSCLLIERNAKSNIKHNPTGNLRSSISHKVDGNTGIVFATERYAPYVEAGTGIHATMGSRAKKIPWRYCDAAGNWYTTYGMKAQPFLKPARDNNISAILKCFEGKI